MSLVNQMLRDLETRRAVEHHVPGTVFAGLEAGPQQGTAKRRLAWLLAGVLAALAAVMGYRVATAPVALPPVAGAPTPVPEAKGTPPPDLKASVPTPETGPEAPLPVASAHRPDPDPRQAAMDTLGRWTRAWSARDADTYLSLYAPGAAPDGGPSRGRWESVRRRRLSAPQWIRVELEDLAIRENDPDTVTAEFRQRYTSNLHQDRTRKRVVLVHRDGRWLIRSEQTIEPPKPGGSPAPEKTAAAREPAAMQKTPRPPSPRQRAALAYREAASLLEKGQRGDAVPRLRKALELEPGHGPARDTLAALLLSMGRLVEAGEVLEEGLARRPHDPGLSGLYARLQVERNDVAGAVQTLEQALPQAAQDANYVAFLAALYQRLGRYRESAAAYRQALGRDPGKGVWWLGLAISLEGAGEGSEAAAAYRRALAAGLSGDPSAYARRRLGALTETGEPAPPR